MIQKKYSSAILVRISTLNPFHGKKESRVETQVFIFKFCLHDTLRDILSPLSETKNADTEL
jgi:hypothetical protein